MVLPTVYHRGRPPILLRPQDRLTGGQLVGHKQGQLPT